MLPLERDTDQPVEVLGGKAAGLARLLRAGFRVPRAYVVTTEAFRRTLTPALQGLRTPEEMREAVLGCELPAEVARAVADAHAAIFGDMPVAVRSSAISEDAAQRSFAGQLESVLGVVGVEGTLQAIRSVWASYFGPSNLLYRGRASLDERPGAVAVVVQRLLRPRVAGVMFTADPVGGQRDRLVISASEGLGEAVVNGRSTETVYVDLSPRRALTHVSDDAAPVLKERDVDVLVEAAERIHGAFGEPRDVEWAVDEAGLAILQCRPITAGRLAASHRGAVVWSNVNVGEALPGVATPMTWSVIHGFSRLGFEKAFGALGLTVPADAHLFASFRGRIYLNLTELASIFSQVPFMRIGDILALGGGGEAEKLEDAGYERRSRVGFIARLPLTLSRMAVSQVTLPVLARRWSGRFRERRDAFFARDLSRLTQSGLREVLAKLDKDFDHTGGVMLACGANFLSSYLVTSQLLERWGGPEASQKERHLFRGLSGLASAEPGLALLDIAREVRGNPELEQLFSRTPSERLAGELEHTPAGRAVMTRIRAFLEEHGGRAAREAELSTPRWRERPEFLFEVIQSHLEAPYLPTAEDVRAEQMRKRHETTQILRQYFRPGLGVLFRRILSWTQDYARLREELRAHVTDSLAMYRHFLLEVGRRLVSEGTLAAADDVFFLTRPEVDGWLAGGALTYAALTVALRRAEYVAFSRSPDPPDTFVLHGNESIPEAQHSVPGGTPALDGLPASPGRATGRARVIKDLDAAPHLHPGEILVAPFTDVGWTPLFLVAAGVVTDIGGPLSHAAVVAREYGIPAVVNVKEGTALIETGDLITVDGDHGRVFLKRPQMDTE